MTFGGIVHDPLTHEPRRDQAIEWTRQGGELTNFGQDTTAADNRILQLAARLTF